MNIEENLFVSFNYVLTLASGEEIDRSEENEPMGFIAGSGQIISGLENALMGMKAGDSSKIVVEPEEAYGPFSEELVQVIPRDEFPSEEQIEPGMTFEAEGPHGPVMITIIDVNGNESVTVDLNHPLAGKQLTFDVWIAEVREPSQEELDQLAEESSGCCGGDGGCGCDSDGHDSCSAEGGCGCS